MKAPWASFIRGFRSLAGQFLAFQMVVVVVVLIAAAAVSVAQSTREFREVRGERHAAVAENVASTPIVRDRYADPFAARLLAPDVERGAALSGAGLAEIVDPSGRVRASSEPSRIGRSVDLGASKADEGRAWLVTATSTACTAWSGRYRSLTPTARCRPSSRSANGIRRWSAWGRQRCRRAAALLPWLGAALGMLTSWLLSRRINGTPRAGHLAEIASLADDRGKRRCTASARVVAVNTDGEITLLNDSAQELLCQRRGGGLPGGQRRPGTWWSSCCPVRTAAMSSSPPAPTCCAQPARGDEPGQADRYRDHDARQHQLASMQVSWPPIRASPTRCVRRPTSSPTSCTPAPQADRPVRRGAIWSAP